jgi:hypothetical protein
MICLSLVNRCCLSLDLGRVIVVVEGGRELFLVRVESTAISRDFFGGRPSSAPRCRFGLLCGRFEIEDSPLHVRDALEITASVVKWMIEMNRICPFKLKYSNRQPKQRTA